MTEKAGEITVNCSAISIRRKATTDQAGRYQIASLPMADYRIDVRAQGFQTQIVAGVRLEVARKTAQNFQRQIGDVSEEVVVTPTNSIEEFTIDNSTFSAEYGRNSGSIVNLATRSGTNQYHGELIEFFRNDALDARNFFDFNSGQAQPFKRNQFGGSIGGPLGLPRFGEGDSPVAYLGRDRTFFFFAYEGLRQNQAVNRNTVVLSGCES